MGERIVNGLNFNCANNDASSSEKLPDFSGKSSCEVEVTDIERNFGNQSSDLGENCVIKNEGLKKLVENKEEKESCVIDVKCEEDVEVFEGEKVCRICHLNSEQESKSGSLREKNDPMMLGCGCKGELSVAHSHCAEAWFKVKGNRTCEICGQTVTNIKGVGNEGFMEEWKESTSNDNTPNSSERNAEEACWHGQPLCNFLTACLVIAFVVPWFFRINFW
ncbi:uncharacterized protein LOC141592857 [Silene latifolia]|uniref:uncharacterized protein LOC141592857 n=1 Tax=Silene latifolia TaxID=37657 RepID=UPI003D787B24